MNPEIPRSTPHPHATSMLLYARDATKTVAPWRLWECHRRDLPADSPWTALISHPEWNPSHDYRRKPRMIVVNGIKVQAGETEAPADGTEYYFPDTSGTDWIQTDHWHGTDLDVLCLFRGLLYTDRAACEQRAKAMVGVQS